MSTNIISFKNGKVKEEKIDTNLKHLKESFLKSINNEITILINLIPNHLTPELVVFLPPIIKAEEYQQLISFLNEYNNKNTLPMSIYNFRYQNGKIDYDYTSNIHNGKDADVYTALTLFYHEKNNSLTDRESKQIDRYRLFDFERILLTDDGVTHLTSYSSGIIVITEDDLIGENITKENHTDQAIFILHNKKIKTADCKCIEDLIKYGVVIVQMLYNEIIFWFNEPINTFQILAIEKILEKLKIINKKYGLNINVGGEIFHQADYLVTNDIEELETYLNNLKKDHRKR